MMAAADPCFRLCAGAVLPWEVTQRQCHDGGTARRVSRPSHATPMASTFPVSLAITTPHPDWGFWKGTALGYNAPRLLGSRPPPTHHRSCANPGRFSRARVCVASAAVRFCSRKQSVSSLPPVSPYVPGAGESRRNSGGSSCATDE